MKFDKQALESISDKTRKLEQSLINKALKKVYTANQCTDLNDVRIALKRCEKIVKSLSSYETWCNARALYRRINALYNKGDKINKGVRWQDGL